MKTFLFSQGRGISPILLTITIMLCSSANSFAATYYISPTGNDATGTGSAGNPWKTLFKATSTVTTSGDIIYVNAGTYTETQASNLAKGVNIQGAGFVVSVIKSSITGNWSALLRLSSPQDTNGNQSISGVTLDGQYVSESNFKTWVAVWVSGRSNVIIHDCKIINFRDRGVIFDGNDAADPHSDPGHYATGNKFYNNTVLNSAAQNNNYGSGLVNIGGQQGMEIYGNTMIQDQRGTFLNGWPIKYWDEGWLKGVKIYNNILTKKPYDGNYPGEGGNWDFAIELFNISGLEIYNNTIQGSIDLNYNRKGNYAFCAWIHHNTLNHQVFNSKFESGIILEFRTESILIEDNILNNVSSGVQFNTRGVNDTGGNNSETPAPPGGYSVLSNNVIRRNLFSNVYRGTGTGTAAGITVISEGTDDPQIQGLDIYNNTIVAKPGSAPWIGIDFTSMGAPTASGTNINIRNNIVIGFLDSWLKGTSGAGNTHINGMVVTHNNAFGNGNGNVPSWPGGTPSNYIYNTNRAVNPMFVSATDFRLQVLSPLIDAGIYVGTPYVGIAPDGGYDEFGSITLPVSLIDFSVKANGEKNLLSWSTAFESNSNYFDIERSSDGRSFYSIGRVSAAGYSSSELKYNFTDNTPAEGKNFYRLNMVDRDGTFEFSRTVAITNKKSSTGSIDYFYLSPATNTASLTINSTKNQKALLSVIDVNGRIILNTEIQLQTGNNTITRNIPAVPGGVYYARVITPDETLVRNAIAR